MNMRTLITSTALVLGTVLLIPACNTSRAVKGGAVGAGVGAGAGAIIGNQFGDQGTAIGAIIGAAVGGTTGALIGRHMDKQAEELRADLEGATITRVGEGIRITFDSGLLFAVNESSLSGTAQGNLMELATTLKKYSDTEVLVEGHTDADGAEDMNRALSMRRAQQVSTFLTGQGVLATRLSTAGYGEAQPVADNASDEGKAANRRVEIAIYANKRMKKAAERGQL
jgi:outer membrane protein OmpA-like peptidoglycan-associated protein